MEPAAYKEKRKEAFQVVMQANKVMQKHREAIERVVMMCVTLLNPFDSPMKLIKEGRLYQKAEVHLQNKEVVFNYLLDGELLCRAITTYTEEGDEEAITTRFEYGDEIASRLNQGPTGSDDLTTGFGSASNPGEEIE